jgi:hypothetical protein
VNATVLDFRRRMNHVLRALEHNEPVTLFYRGKKKGVLYPASGAKETKLSATEHPAFGMWKRRADMRNVQEYVRRLRKGRAHAL